MSALGDLLRAAASVPGELAAIAEALRTIAGEMRFARRLSSLRELACPATCGHCAARATYVQHAGSSTTSKYINAWWCDAHKPDGATLHGNAGFTTALVQLVKEGEAPR